LQHIDGIVRGLRARAQETERLRRLPEDTVAELKDAGVFQILAPKAAGGYGMSVETYVEVNRRLARGDASTAWTATP
jgi:alkylation response protein AidB-like acyl-CoA dehydrogenase